MPTLPDLCAVPAPDGRSFHGESLAPLMRGGADGHSYERVLVTDTQRVPHPIKWRMSCVMRDRWRLVDHGELYDLATDPGQERDVAAEHPDLVAGRTEAVLRSHDLRSEQDGDAVWNQAQVRAGVECRGWWEIEASEAGEYEFELRRWPLEARRRGASDRRRDDSARRWRACAHRRERGRP